MFKIETMEHNPMSYDAYTDPNPRVTFWRATGGTCDEYVAEVIDADSVSCEDLCGELDAYARRRFGNNHRPRNWEPLIMGYDYEDAAEECAIAWDEIVRGYFGDHAADFDLDAARELYAELTISETGAPGLYIFRDCSTDELNNIAERCALID